MKGIVFNIAEELIRRDLGDEAWDALLQEAGIEGAYTSLGSYPDEEFSRLVETAAVRLGQTSVEVTRWVGRGAMPLLYARYPTLLDRYGDTRSLLLSLNSVVHPEVRKLYPGARTPTFTYDTSDPDVLKMGYDSPRRLCGFAEGLTEGAAVHYRERAEIEQVRCTHRGDPVCLFHIRFYPKGAPIHPADATPHERSIP